jgi:hypothetical protein
MAVAFTKIGDHAVVASYTAVTTANSAAQTATTAPLGAEKATMTVSGTFGGATVTLHGSNDGTNFVLLKDAASAALSVATTGAGHVIPTGFRFYKPVVTGGTADSLAITLVFSKRGKSSQ